LPTEVVVKRKRDEVKQLEVIRDAIREEEVEQQRIVVQWQSDVRLLEEGLGELRQADVTLLETYVFDTHVSPVAAEEALVQVPGLEQKIEQLKKEEVSIKEQLAVAEEKLNEAARLHAGAQAVLRDRASDIPEHLRAHEALELAKEQAAARVRLLKQALETAQQEVSEVRQTGVAREITLKALLETAEESQYRVEAMQSEFAGRLRVAGFAND
jgi:hypothetical protein